MVLVTRLTEARSTLIGDTMVCDAKRIAELEATLRETDSALADLVERLPISFSYLDALRIKMRKRRACSIVLGPIGI